VSTEKGRGVA